MHKVLTQPSLETFNERNGLSANLPLTGYHLTSELMVTSLSLTIERLIELGNSAEFRFTSTEDFGLSLTVEERWKDYIDKLMKGLFSLDGPIGSSQAVFPASQKLLSTYGDILSECWSTSFET